MDSLTSVSSLKELNQINPNGFEIKVKEMIKKANQQEAWFAEFFLEKRICYLIQCATIDAWKAAFEGKDLITFNPRNMLKDASFDEYIWNAAHVMVNIEIKLEDKGFVLNKDVDCWYSIGLKGQVSNKEVKDSIKSYLDDFLYAGDELCGDGIVEKAKPMIKKLKKCLNEL